jgi:hypothetical protein
MPYPKASDLVLQVLRTILNVEGSQAAARHAEEMIVTASTVLACESGLDVALVTLDRAATATRQTMGERKKVPVL